jgi:protein-tyrosine phosphatase
MKPRSIPIWSLVVVTILVAIGVGLDWPHPSPGPPLELPLKSAQDVPVLRNKQGELLLYNFRAVEPGVLYRSSGFPRNRRDPKDGKKTPAAFVDGQAFEFMRAHNIRTVVDLQETEYYYGEEGYYDYWAKKTGYQVKVISLPLKSKHAYDLNSNGGVAAAAKFLEIMKQHRPDDGAVLVHCDAGKDRAGVAVAAYELWRDKGKMDEQTLWQQVRRRYLASNQALAQDEEVSRFAGGEVACPAGDDIKQGFVCPGWLDKLRHDLEIVAQL